MLVVFFLTTLQAAAPPPLVAACSLAGDAQRRVYELRRRGDEIWLFMRSRAAGTAPVILPLPGARPAVSASELTLSYSTLNGGRSVEWRITPSAATLDVHANFELEVNVEPDLDPRVELMNTEGPVEKLTCDIAPQRR